MKVEHFWYANQTENIPAIWHYSSGIFSLLCLIIGIISNGLVIFVFMRNTVLRKPRNYFLINLAITDLGLLLTNNSLHVISSFKKQWIFGQTGCDFYSVCGGIFGLTSIATMASISLTRLVAVNNPYSSLKLTSRFTLFCLACTWIYGSIWIMPPLFGWNRFILEGFGTSCTFDYVSQNIWDRLFILILVIGGFFIPLTIILCSYGVILTILSQRSRRFIPPLNVDQQDTTYYFKELQATDEIRVRSAAGSTLDCSDKNFSRIVRRSEARATRTALLICAVFCLAWGPYAIMALISLFGFNYLINPYTTSVLGMCTKLAACVNPLIYALSLNGFREQICLYMKCICQCNRNIHDHLIPINRDVNMTTSTRQRLQSDAIHRLS